MVGVLEVGGNGRTFEAGLAGPATLDSVCKFASGVIVSRAIAQSHRPFHFLHGCEGFTESGGKQTTYTPYLYLILIVAGYTAGFHTIAPAPGSSAVFIID